VIEHLVHASIPPSTEPLCGAPDPGPVPLDGAFKVSPCLDCMRVGPEGIPREMRMEAQLERVRTALRRKLAAKTDAERSAWRSSVLAVASGGLADPDAAPALYEKPQLLAALYAVWTLRATFWHLRRAGMAPTWAMIDAALAENEMTTVALAEGTPL
jgi:hypothetical protein